MSYSYDLSGNATSRSGAGGALLFSYYGDDWLRRARNAAGAIQYYYYDHSDRRILTVNRSPAGAIDGARLVFGNLDVEYVSSTAIAKTTVNLSLGTSLATVEDRGAPRRIIQGQLGHILAAFQPDASGLAVAYTYGPFGEMLERSGDPSDFIRRFNGKEQDDTTELLYYGYRYFDPHSLVWTQADPLYRFRPDHAFDEPRSANLYAFSRNNALRFFDPDGRDDKLQYWAVMASGYGCGGGMSCAKALAFSRSMHQYTPRELAEAGRGCSRKNASRG